MHGLVTQIPLGKGLPTARGGAGRGGDGTGALCRPTRPAAPGARAGARAGRALPAGGRGRAVRERPPGLQVLGTLRNLALIGGGLASDISRLTFHWLARCWDRRASREAFNPLGAARPRRPGRPRPRGPTAGGAAASAGQRPRAAAPDPRREGIRRAPSPAFPALRYVALLSGRGGAPGVARGLGRERGDWRGGRPADTPPLEKGSREWRGEKVNRAGRPCPLTNRGGGRGLRT